MQGMLDETDPLTILISVWNIKVFLFLGVHKHPALKKYILTEETNQATLSYFNFSLYLLSCNYLIIKFFERPLDLSQDLERGKVISSYVLQGENISVVFPNETKFSKMNSQINE